MKSGRHARILELISEQSIETQDDLLNCLRQDGYKATQATISRDIKDLRLVKALDSDGKYRYMSPAKNQNEKKSSLKSMFSTAVNSIDAAQNIVVWHRRFVLRLIHLTTRKL